MNKNKETIDLTEIHIELRRAVTNECLDDDYVDSNLADQLGLTLDELQERVNNDGLDARDEFCKLLGLKFIELNSELGDIEKAYWDYQIIFQRISDGKYFGADYSESDRDYWGGFSEVRALIEVERKEKKITLVTYE